MNQTEFFLLIAVGFSLLNLTLIVSYFVLKITGFKAVFYQRKNGIIKNSQYKNQDEFLLPYLHEILEAQTSEQKIHNQALLEQYEIKTEGFKKVSYKLMSTLNSLQDQFLELKADFAITKSLEKELKKELDSKNQLIEKYAKGFLVSHATSAMQKIILTINGIFRDKTIKEDEKTDRIIELESILNAFNIERIEVKEKDVFDPKIMNAMQAIPTSDEKKHNLVSEIISYGYVLKEGNTEKVLSQTKVIVYKLNQIRIGE
jgi:molecular chaperone GrpE (heat shock protein)